MPDPEAARSIEEIGRALLQELEAAEQREFWGRWKVVSEIMSSDPRLLDLVRKVPWQAIPYKTVAEEYKTLMLIDDPTSAWGTLLNSVLWHLYPDSSHRKQLLAVLKAYQKSLAVRQGTSAGASVVDAASVVEAATKNIETRMTQVPDSNPAPGQSATPPDGPSVPDQGKRIAQALSNLSLDDMPPFVRFGFKAFMWAIGILVAQLIAVLGGFWSFHERVSRLEERVPASLSSFELTLREKELTPIRLELERIRMSLEQLNQRGEPDKALKPPNQARPKS